MKPIRLKLSAFGSFAGTEEIDFEALAARGLFVVSGDTGTGKTTIFDAMCWALYGTMPLKDNVRSDHVGDTVPTSVEFTFECDGDRYHVTRRPEQRVHKKRGVGYKLEGATASLVRLDGDVTTAVASKVTDVTRECETLVGLDANQFQRVVLLPQGEFSRFLIAKQVDREALLSALFGGRLYETVVEELKHRRNELDSVVSGVDANINSRLDVVREQLTLAHEMLGLELPDDIGSADHETLRTIGTRVGESIDALKIEVDRLTRAAKKADTAHRVGENAAKLFDEAVGYRSELTSLDAAREQIETRRNAALGSREARPVIEDAERVDQARTARDNAVTTRDASLAALVTDFELLGVALDTPDLHTINQLLAAARSENDTGRRNLDARDEAQAKFDESVKTKDALGNELSSLRDRQVATAAEIDETRLALEDLQFDENAVERLETAIKALETSITQSEELTKVDRLLDRAREETREATVTYDAVFRAFVATEAPRLAETLEHDKPCPVCGSTEHPAPAIADDGTTPTTFEQVDQAHTDFEKARRNKEELERNQTALLTALGDDAGKPVDDLRARLEMLRVDLETTERKREEARALETRRTDLADERSGLEKKIAAADAEFENATKAAAAAQDAVQEAETLVSGVDRAALDDARTVLGRIDTAAGLFESTTTDVTKTETQLSEAKRHLDERIDASPFDSVEAARAAIMAEADEKSALEAARTHQDATNKARIALSQLEKNGLPDERPDIEALLSEAEAAERRREKANRTLGSATHATETALDALSRHDELVSRSGTLRRNLETVRRVHTVCSRNGAALERWVLARELDRVTAAATVHLEQMTGGRYGLRRAVNEKAKGHDSDLELEITDSNTGRPRSTKSLSGGEQFQASLALALGLKDIVSQGGTGSGKRFEALFIDEGFGSLSSDSLDDAIRTLEHLQARGHLIGAITHVDAMKQSLHVGIEVKRRADGKGSTITVHP